MRIGGFRIGFALVGSALLAAGVTSMAIAAQNHETAAPRCYSTCPSKTGLAVSAHTITFGSENTEVFTVKVRSKIRHVPGTPTGTVTVMYRSTTLCTMVLVNGTGTCSPSATALAPRRKRYPIRAFYSGDASFTGSHARRQPVTVVS